MPRRAGCGVALALLSLPPSLTRALAAGDANPTEFGLHAAFWVATGEWLVRSGVTCSLCSLHNRFALRVTQLALLPPRTQEHICNAPQLLGKLSLKWPGKILIYCDLIGDAKYVKQLWVKSFRVARGERGTREGGGRLTTITTPDEGVWKKCCWGCWTGAVDGRAGGRGRGRRRGRATKKEGWII